MGEVVGWVPRAGGRPDGQVLASGAGGGAGRAALRLRVAVCGLVGCVALALSMLNAGSAAASGWAVDPISAPPVPNGKLVAVWCSSANACVAVGSFTDGRGNQVTLVERLKAGTWSIQRTPNPTEATDSRLGAVSCTSPTACTAVGYSGNSAGTWSTLAERWNGAKWSIQMTPDPAAGGSVIQLTGVSCTSATACTAVGSTLNGGLIWAEHWNGIRWSIQTIPNPTGATLNGVSCTSDLACTAVGGFADSTGPGAGGLTLAERWNGTRWSIQTTPNPAGPRFDTDQLNAVSCTSSTSCTAVGNRFTNGYQTFTLAERWNGATWSILTTPSPTDGSQLTGVWCTSAAACTAVGSYYNGAHLTLAERWNGATWSIQSTPNPTPDPAIGTVSELTGVSCTSDTTCTAVADSNQPFTPAVTLAERWSANRWSVQMTPNPTGPSASSQLTGISCPSASACFAVGSYLNRRA